MCNEEKCWLLGKINIASNKMSELNRRVLEVLEKGGIRKVETVMLDGKSVLVVNKVKPDKKGMLRFDYSIYEMKQRDLCTYDMKTGKLTVDECGNEEFGFVMVALMCLLESYTNGNCYVMCDSKPMTRISTYLRVLEGMLGEKIKLNNRGRLWEMIQFFHYQRTVDDLSPLDAISAIPWDYVEFDWNQIDVLWSMAPQQIEYMASEKYTGKPDIKNLNLGRKYNYLLATMERLLWHNEKETIAYLRNLMDCCMAQRMKLAAQENNYRILAELSLYLLPHALVGAYAYAKKVQIWDAWEDLKVVGYKDIFPHKKIGKIGEKITGMEALPLYKAMQRDYADEYLEYAKDRELLSNGLKHQMEKWKQKYGQVESIDKANVESYLTSIMIDLDQSCCQYVDRDFVDWMLSHREDVHYRKALVLMREIINEELERYMQNILSGSFEHELYRHRPCHVGILVMAYESMMMNEVLRGRILGF